MAILLLSDIESSAFSPRHSASLLFYGSGRASEPIYVASSRHKYIPQRVLTLQTMLLTASTHCFHGRLEYPGMPAPLPTNAHPAFSVVTSSVKPIGAHTAAKIATCVLPEIRRASFRDTRYLLGLYGMPGSGKSTVAAAVQHVLRALAPEISTAVVSMDGWHFSRKELDGFEDSVEAHERRGAPFTFNARAFGNALGRCRNRDGGVIELPSFDHALKDPIERDVRIDAGADVVIVEGLFSHFAYLRRPKSFSCTNRLSTFFVSARQLLGPGR